MSTQNTLHIPLLQYLVMLTQTVTGAVCEVKSQAWQWATMVGGPVTDNNNISPDETIKSMVTDTQGNVYACGTVLTPAQINSVPITTYGGYNIFIAKYDCHGNLVWHKTAGSTGENKAYDLLLDGNGGLYVTGNIQAQSTSSCYFFDSTITEQAADLFISKFDTSGDFKWVRWAAPGSTSQGTVGLQMAMDSEGMINVLIRNTGTGDLFPGYSLNVQGYQVARFDTSGNINKLTLLVNAIASPPNDFKIDVSDNNSIYLIGRISGTTATIGGQVYNRIAALGGSDMYVVKLDSGGQHLWGIHHGMPGLSVIAGFGIDKSGPDWLITGHSIDSAVLGSFMFHNTIGTVGKYFPFWAKINSSGTVLFADNSQTEFGSMPSAGIITLPNGNYYIGGWFAGQFIAGNDSIPNSNGLTDAFLCEINQTGSVVATTILDCTGSKEEPECITRDTNDNIFLGGGVDGTVTINGNSISSSGGNTDAFIAKFGTICTVGMEEILQLADYSIYLYPNPVTEKLYIKTNDLNETFVVSIYNTLGQSVFEQEFKNNTASGQIINVSKMNPGIYFVNVFIGNEMKIARFVKQ